MKLGIDYFLSLISVDGQKRTPSLTFFFLTFEIGQVDAESKRNTPVTCQFCSHGNGDFTKFVGLFTTRLVQLGRNDLISFPKMKNEISVLSRLSVAVAAIENFQKMELQIFFFLTFPVQKEKLVS